MKRTKGGQVWAEGRKKIGFRHFKITKICESTIEGSVLVWR